MAGTLLFITDLCDQ